MKQKKTLFVAIAVLLLMLLAVAVAVAYQTGQETEEDKNIESELDVKTDSGTFVRLIGADQVGIRISGVPEAIPPRVFRLYEEVAANFDTLELEEGDQVRFSYSINSQNEDVITEIEKIFN
ncbi:MAG: hypothetical protein SCK29_06415 [Bacillota bacterium]|nr:hypothetical protein [Bacillota bacterium]MDW7683740.1 hypothetical protein [Bacillota bacterium]